MRLVFDAFWRAVAYCLHPRVIALSLLPVVLAGGAAFALGWFFWEDAVNGVRNLLEQWELLAPAMEWINRISGGLFRTVIGPLVVTVLSIPVLLIVSLLLVAFMMGPAIVDLVTQRRFRDLERKRGGGWLVGSLRSFALTVVALLALTVSLPLWLVPPLALLLPPLIWGWLSYKVMAHDALTMHASGDERRSVMRAHRWPLLGMGVITGYLGAVPSLVWVAFGVMTLPWLPVVVPVFVWLYTLVFAFAMLWFTHYALAALQAQRLSEAAIARAAREVPPPPAPPALDAPGAPSTGGPTSPTPSPRLPAP